jgi:hypothetical protein
MAKVTHSVSKGQCFRDRCECRPLWLVNTNRVKHSTELVSVFSSVNVLRACA